MKNILAIDSSCGPCSVAVYGGGKVLAYKQELEVSLQAKHLVLMVEEALAESGLAYSDLGRIAVSIGPGSFTGIRIALAAARGIGFSSGIPVLGFNGLSVLAFGASEEGQRHPIIANLNAGKGEIIYQYFSPDCKGISEPTLAKEVPAANEGYIVVGHIGESAIKFPRADLLAKFAANYPDKACPPLPFYVRPPDAKLPSELNK